MEKSGQLYVSFHMKFLTGDYLLLQRHNLLPITDTTILSPLQRTRSSFYRDHKFHVREGHLPADTTSRLPHPSHVHPDGADRHPIVDVFLDQA